MTVLAKIARSGLDLLYPRDCLVTGEPVEDDSPCRYLSHKGIDGLFMVKEPCCPTCGFPFFGELLASRICPHCRELEPAFGRGRTLMLARDAGREIIHELKYHNGRYLLPDIRTLIRGQAIFCEHLAGAVLVPVPLFARRLRERGFNQSLLLTKAFAEEAEGASVEELLVRVRDTQTQTRLNRKQRLDNMRGAFAMKKGRVADPQTRYVLVDDVFTTGATLNACARALRRGGAELIDVATLAHG